MQYDRSGTRLGGLKMGRWACLRQEMLMAGETIQTAINGKATFAALRQPAVSRSHAKLVAFYTPLRWLWPGFTDYVIDGVDTTETIPTQTVAMHATAKWDSLGIGTVCNGDVIDKHWIQNWNSVYHWYMKLPDRMDTDPHDDDRMPVVEDEARYGRIAVNLPNYVTRLRDAANVTVDTADVQFDATVRGANAEIDLRKIEELGARFKSEQGRAWFGTRGYQEIVQSVWDAKGSLEVEKRPWLIDETGDDLEGHNVTSMEEETLGSRAGIQDFSLSHRLKPFTAPEQGIISYWMVIRWDPRFYKQSSPLATSDNMEYMDFVGDPQRLAHAQPEHIRGRRISQEGESTHLVGMAPRGQHWRTGWDQVDGVIATAANFPIQTLGTPAANSLYAYCQSTDHAFQTEQFGHAIVDLRFRQMCTNDVPAITDSIYTGAID